MFGVSPKVYYYQDDGWNCADENERPIAFQSMYWFNGHHGWKSVSGNWNDITTKHFAGSEELEVDLLLDIDNKKLSACVVGNCVNAKKAKFGIL